MHKLFFIYICVSISLTPYVLRCTQSNAHTDLILCTQLCISIALFRLIEKNRTKPLSY